MRCIAIPAVLFGIWIAAGSAAALTIEAEQAPVRSAGAPMKDGWNLHSNGEVGGYVLVPADGDYTVTVRAGGTPCRGEWPKMAVAVDRRPAVDVRVGRKDFADYAVQVPLTAGVRLVTVAFLNDAVAGGEDRNLFLDRIAIAPLKGAQELRSATAADYAAEDARREQQALARADAGIEKHRKSDAAVAVVRAGKPVADANVRVELVRHAFLFGCNIYAFDRFKTDAENAAYKQRFADLFNYATLGFYWRAYERERGKPNYALTDTVAAWCRERGIRMKGHPLLWGLEAGVPRWSDGQPPAEVQKARVQEIVRRYAGTIEFWEVVNEPSHCRGVTIDGPYRWAREADPSAHLIVNDYSVFDDGEPNFLRLLEKAKADGVPFDGIGIQAHEPRTMRFPLDRVQEILDHYATLGKAIHITEFSPCSGGQPITGSHVTGTWTEQAQAEYAERFYRVCFGHPAIVGITWWDLCDAHSWLPGGGLLRKDLSPKPAYEVLHRLICETWRTRADGRTDAAGAFPFRGVHGLYRVTVTSGGKTVTREETLEPGQPNRWTVSLEY